MVREVKTCLRYPGGKFYGFKIISPFLNINHWDYIEPFVGGASMFLGKKKSPGKSWLNDKDPELINFYKIIQNEETRKALYELLKNEIANKERHKEVLSIEPKNDVERAFKYFYLNRTSFSGVMNSPRWGYAIGSSVTPDRWIDLIEPVAKKLQGVKLTNLDFRDVLESISNEIETLIYIDPPYFNASKSIYNHEFSLQDHIDLMNILKKMKAKFILSYENSPEIKKIYNWAHIKEVTWKYFMSEERRQVGSELIITNFQLEDQETLN